MSSGPTVFVGKSGRWLVPSGNFAVHHFEYGSDPSLPGDVMNDLRHRPGPRPVAVGFLSFRPDAPARFVVADQGDVRGELRAGGAHNGEHSDQVTDMRPDQPGPVMTITEVPAATAFAHAVELALAHIAQEPELTKVVLGRWAHVALPTSVDIAELAQRLSANNPLATVFGMPAPSSDGADGEAELVGVGEYVVGASPELLVARRGQMVECRPLAGSMPRGATPKEDAERTAELASSAKNVEEHAIVVQAMRDALAPLCTWLEVPATPELVATDAMWHLGTSLRGELTSEAAETFSALHLAQLLHPTPAVAGWPTARARELIADLEPEDRGIMTGAVGWVDAHGDGEFHVTIRAALLQGSRARLFAGAGIVAGSVPDVEVAETAAKLSTMLRVLQ